MQGVLTWASQPVFSPACVSVAFALVACVLCLGGVGGGESAAAAAAPALRALPPSALALASPPSFKDCVSSPLGFTAPSSTGFVFAQPTRVPSKFVMALPSEDWVGKNVRNTGIYAPVESLIFYTVLDAPARPAGIVVDVGVNIGWFSTLSLSLGYAVIGFEPQAHIHPFLHATAALNRSPPSSFRLFECALGGEYGHIGMAATDFWATSSVAAEGEGAPTPRVVLSDMVRQDVALLKVDTEGYERHVFDGAGPLLRGHDVANIVVEMKTAASREMILPLLEGLGYQCFIYTEKYETRMDVPATHEERLELLQSLLSPCTQDSEDYFLTKDKALAALLSQ